VAQTATLLALMHDVTDSNLGQDNSYSDRIYMVFLTFSKQLPVYDLKIDHDRFVPNPFYSIIPQ
jgi:hypothetical protein